MDVTYQINRRKACDLCFVKKIKCDMMKPTCSNCQAYEAKCRTTRTRKSRASARGRLGGKSTALTAASDPEQGHGNSSDVDRMERVESRLARIEERLNDVFTRSVADGENQAPRLSFAEAGQYLSDFDSIFADDSNRILGQPSSVLNEPSQHPFADAGQVPGEVSLAGFSFPALPALATIQPAIDHYFSHVNSRMPIFSEKLFNRMLQGYYTSTSSQTRPAWAAVNVVLALGSRLPTSPSDELELGSGDQRAARYINNAQMMLAEIVAKDASLLGLQVVVGLVAVSHTMKDSRPATVLIGTAVRLAQRLHLGVPADSKLLSSEESLQRDRVFWVVYLFDKDISLRHHTPSLQSNADIGIDLPAENPPDNVGYVTSKDRHARFHFFRARVQLAHIQGRVYELLFAIRAKSITEQERKKRVFALHCQLELWRHCVPATMQADTCVKHVEQEDLFWMCLMHFSYLGCLVMIHGIWSHDAEWRQRLAGTGDARDGSLRAPPLPIGWKNCVNMSRHCMSMMYRIPLSHCSVWTNGCAYFSALLILEAHVFENPRQEITHGDLQLIDFAICVLDRMSEASEIMAMKRMNVVASELASRARQAVANAPAHSLDEAENSPSACSGYAAPESREARIAASKLQWQWNNAGVEAWPRMDVSLNPPTVPESQAGVAGLDLQFPENITEEDMNAFFESMPLHGSGNPMIV